MKKRSTSKSQNKTEMALNASEQRYRTTMMSVGDGVIATDTEGRVEMMNPVAEELTGWKLDKALGKSLEEIFHIVNEETRQTVENPVRRAIREGIVVGLANHSVLIAKDGTEHPIADSGAPIRNEMGKITGVVLVFRDQTHERTAQKALQESERKFHEAVKYLDQGYYSVTTDGLLIDHNQAYNRVLGIDITQELKGQKTPDFWQDQEDRKQYLNELMAQGFIRNYLANAKKINGETIVVLLNSHLIKDENNKVVRIEGTITDFTRIKLMEDALKESEAKYKTLFENAQVGMYRSKIDGSEFLDVNKKCAEIFGLTREELLGAPANIRWANTEDRDKMMRLIKEQGGILNNYEVSVFTKNGEVRNLLASIELHANEGYLDGTMIDITDRKRAEEALLASEVRYRSYIEATGHIGWVTNADGEVIEDVPSLRKFSGQTYEETKGSGWAKTLHPDDLERSLQVWNKAVATKSFYEIEYRMRRHDGVYRYMLARGFPIFREDGSILEWVGTCIDITDRKLAEEVIKDNEKRFRELIESLPQLFWTCRVDGPCDYLSKQWVEYTGVPEAEQLGYRWLEQLHSEDKDRTVSEWMEKVKTGNSFDIELRIRRNDSVYHWFKTTAVPMLDAKGSILKWFGSNTDIDKIKKAEERLRKLNRIYSLLSDINQAIVRTRVPEELFDKVCNIAVEQGGFGMAWIGLVDETSQKLGVIAQAGRTNGYHEQVNISLKGKPLSYCPIDSALRTGKHNICKIIENEEMAPCQKIAYDLGFRSSASFPLKISDILKGALTFYSDEPDFFDEAELKLLDELALDISFAMEYAEKEAGRKQAEEAMQESERKFRETVTYLDEGYYSVTIDGLLLDHNQAFSRILGFDIAKDLKGAKLPDFWQVPEDRKQYLNELIAHGFIRNYMVNAKKINGEKIDVMMNSHLVKDEKGGLVRIDGTFTDFTERKRAEETLRNSEAFLNNIIDQNPVPMWISDDKGILIRINKACCSTLKITEQDVIGKYNVIEDNIVQEQGLLSDVRRVFDNGEMVRFEIRYNTSKLEGFSLESEAEVILDTTIFPIKDYKGKVTNAVILHMDITGRKIAEEALRESEIELRTILDATPFPLASVDVQDNNIDFWSHSALTLFGHTAPTAKEWYEIAYPDPDYRQEVIDRWKPLLEEARQSERAVNTGEYRVTCRDGSVRICELYVIFLAERLIITFNDITDRKQAEEALRESEVRFRIAAETSNDVVYEWDLKQEVIWFGKIDEMLGYAPGEFPRTLEGLGASVHPEDWVRVMAAVQAHLEGRAPYAEDYRVLMKDGTFRWWSARGAVERMADGKPVRWVGTVTDITERKRAEETLRESEARYKTLVENIPQKIFMKDRDYRWMSINENFARDFGIRPEEIVGKLDRDLFSNELADKYHADDVRIITTGKTEELEEKYVADGKETWVNTIKTPVLDKTGEIVGVLGIFWDITGRKLAEEEIRKLNTELEDRVVLRTAQLEVTNKELEAFSYSVSHDLRAPLRHVSGYVELLNKRFQSDLPEKGRHYLDSISDSVHVMGMLIDDLLQFSRSGRMEMHQSDFNMSEIVKEVRESLSQDNPDRKIEWVVGELPFVNGDEAMLRLVWINLLSNAVKFTRPRKKTRIEIGFSKEKKELIFFVRDNGVGFDMQYAQKLFGVFQRLHPTEEFEGTGIGLANVQRIVLRHGGRTWAEAKPDKGAVFYFSIPNK